MQAHDTSNPLRSLALGLDAGGTQTRWAVAGADGRIHAEGQVAGFSALQLAQGSGHRAGHEAGNEAGQAAVQALLAEVARHCGPVRSVVAGVTGFDAAQSADLRTLLSSALGVPPATVRTLSDIELAFHAAFAPGEGIVVYAGTGSIAAHIDRNGTLQRAGGRGAVIDDAGGGHWIAREALRCVWRAEDETPGASQRSTLGRALAAGVGGNDWPAARQWVYGASRGELGLLARAVAQAAQDGDALALNILQAAGTELARLGHVLLRRLGPQPLELAGRVFDLHPSIEARLRETLPAHTPVTRSRAPAHHAAAHMAWQGISS